MPPVVSPLSHRRVDLAPTQPGVIIAVEPGSLADALGLRAGDRVASVNGRVPHDALDFQFHAQNERVKLEIDRGGRTRQYDLELAGDEFWGVTFTDPTFDGVRICENSCPFCFIKQIPKGMRRSLYVMDDDYRYSMLYGSFVTLTNLTNEDWERIEEQRVSPMHVSVHATNPDLRTALVGNPKGAHILEDLERLNRAGIDFHAQLVLCPGVNDGDEMDRSIRELAALPNCLSIAGVPVGLTRFGQERQSKQMRLSRTCMRLLPERTIHVRRYESDEAAVVIAQAERWQQHFRETRGETFLHLGDEFYLMTGREVPSAELYDGYPQLEDGIGITRHLIEQLDNFIRRSRPGGLPGARGTIACGALVGPTMREIVDRFNQHTGAVLETAPLVNTYFGPEINVSGLLTGKDLRGAFSESESTNPVYISARMISDRTHTLLDDDTLPALRAELRRPVVPCMTMSDVAKDLRGRLRQQQAA